MNSLDEYGPDKSITNEDIIRRIEQTERLMEEVKLLGYERTNQLAVRIDSVKEDTKVMATQIDSVEANTKDMVAAFQAAKGAFQVLEWLAKAVKPIMMVGAAAGAFILYVKGLR